MTLDTAAGRNTLPAVVLGDEREELETESGFESVSNSSRPAFWAIAVPDLAGLLSSLPLAKDSLDFLWTCVCLRPLPLACVWSATFGRTLAGR